MHHLTTEAPTTSGSAWTLVIPLLLLLPLIWMMWTQRKRAKEAMLLNQSLAIGDEVITTSGLFGTVIALEDAVATLEIAPDVVVRFDRRAIGMRVPAIRHEEGTE